MNCLKFAFCHSSCKIQIQGTDSNSASGANTKSAKMKKLNIFSAANKKDRKDDARLTSLSCDTINKIVSKKEEVKLYF